MEVAEVQKQYIRELLIKGRKIEAIKYLRTNFDLSLKDSKRLAELIDEDIAEDEYQQHPSLLKNRGGSIIGLVFGVVGAILLSIIIYLIIANQNFLKEAHSTRAVVVSNPARPVFEYNYDGQTYTHYSNVSSNPPAYHIGEEVEIYVNRNDPSDILIDTFMDRWFVITLLGGMGTLFFSIGLTAFFLFKRR